MNPESLYKQLPANKEGLQEFTFTLARVDSYNVEEIEVDYFGDYYLVTFAVDHETDWRCATEVYCHIGEALEPDEVDDYWRAVCAEVKDIVKEADRLLDNKEKNIDGDY